MIQAPAGRPTDWCVTIGLCVAAAKQGMGIRNCISYCGLLCLSQLVFALSGLAVSHGLSSRWTHMLRVSRMVCWPHVELACHEWSLHTRWDMCFAIAACSALLWILVSHKCVMPCSCIWEMVSSQGSKGCCMRRLLCNSMRVPHMSERPPQRQPISWPPQRQPLLRLHAIYATTDALPVSRHI